MNTARYQELLGRLLEDELSVAEAEELAAGLSAFPALRQDLRQHLVLWELWSQHQAPERSAESFLNGWKTRLRVESESADAFPEAVRERLQSPTTIVARVRAIWATVRHRPGWAWAASVTVAGLAAFFWVAAPRSAHAVTTIRGEAVCTACVLHESHQHLPAVRVTDGDGTRIYYLDRNAAVSQLQDYFCGGPKPVAATGMAKTEAGRLLFNAATVTISSPTKSGEQPTNDVRTIFPI